MNASRVVLFAAVLGSWFASPANAADANSSAGADSAGREMKLDTFLSRFDGWVADYKEANDPAKKEAALGELRKRIQLDSNDLTVTLSGRVTDVKVQKDGSVKVALSQVAEIEHLRGKPLMGLFRRGAAEWAEGGSLSLKMTAAQAAAIKKGDAWRLRGRAVFLADANSVDEVVNIQVYMVAMVRVVKYLTEKNISVGAFSIPKYSCTIGGVTFESAGAG